MQTALPTVHLLANPRASRGRTAPTIAQIALALEAEGANVVTVPALTAAEAEVACSLLVAEQAERIVVVGGDGMVHLAAQAVATTDTVLGVIPLGTGNDFAGSLGLSVDVQAAARTALAPPTPIDLMRVGDRWAASVATAGFSVDVNRLANEMRWPRGSSRYTLATLARLPRLAARSFELTVDGDLRAVEALVLTVANTSDFGGGMRITPDADPRDGQLDITLVGAASRVELLRWFRKVFDGSHLDHPAVTTLRGRNISISAGAGEVWADGEPVTSAPTTITVVAGALQLALSPDETSPPSSAAERAK